MQTLNSRICRSILSLVMSLSLMSCGSAESSHTKEESSSFTKQTVSIAGYQTQVFLPESYDSQKKYKTLVLLHGALIPNAIDFFLELFSFQNHVNQKDFIILAPFSNNPVTLWAWNLSDIKKELDSFLDGASQLKPSEAHTLSGESIDYDQLYLTGYSGGARAAFMYVAQENPKYYMKGMVIFGGDGVGGVLVAGDHLQYSKPAYPLSLFQVHAQGDYMVPTQNGISTFKSFTSSICEEISPESSYSNQVSLTEGLSCPEGVSTKLYHVKEVNNSLNPHAINVNAYGLVSVILQDLFR